MSEMLQTDLSGLHLGMLKTKELAFQKQQNLPLYAQWMLDALRDGKWWKTHEEEEQNGEEQEAKFITKDHVWNHFLESCRAQGRKQYLSREQLSKHLIDCLGFEPRRKREGKGERIPVYALPWLKSSASEVHCETFELSPDLFADDPDIEDDDKAGWRGARAV